MEAQPGPPLWLIVPFIVVVIGFMDSLFLLDGDSMFLKPVFYTFPRWVWRRIKQAFQHRPDCICRKCEEAYLDTLMAPVLRKQMEKRANDQVTELRKLL